MRPVPAIAQSDPVPPQTEPVTDETEPVTEESEPVTPQSEPVTEEPAFDVASITYDESTNSVSGRVTGDVSGCYVILYIQVAGVYWVKPTEAEALTSIDSTGAFRMNAYSSWSPEATKGDLSATAYKLYLVEGETSIGLNSYTGSYLDIYEGIR